MGHYIANLRDIEFLLFDLLERDKVLGVAPFDEYDQDTAVGMLEEMKRLAENELADSFVEGDRQGVSFDPTTGDAKLPEIFHKSYRAYMDGEWWRMDAPAELGGIVIPPTLRWAIGEMVLGSNPGVHLYSSGSSFANVIYSLGTEEQKLFAKQMLDNHWTATMMLTEPEAGSDVGAGRSKAVAQSDGTWHLTGTKRFITSGESDLEENVVHLVLARPEGAGPGTKGLSLFVVPKFMVDWQTGKLGERNGIFVTNIEHKMGLNISSTCEFKMGENAPCVGYLLGEVHDGIAQMFKVIEFARMMVGTKAIATLGAGYQQALAYAKTRVQGPDLTQTADKTSPRVTISHHPDVRRSLMTQKSYSEGMRALVLYTASIQDDIIIARSKGEDPKKLVALNDLLLPVVKGYGSEKSWVLLGTESLQIFGGSGFTKDWPLEQYVRDAKIDTLYEGTTAIQGLDFFFRKIVRDRGEALALLASEIAQFAKGDPGDGTLSHERELLSQALDDVQTMVGTMVGHAMDSQSEPREIYKVGLNSSRLLLATGELITAWLLLRSGEVASEKLKESGLSTRDRSFYEGKVAAAKFFAQNFLPPLSADRVIVETTDNAIMDLAEESF
ncbi:MAG TPA: acyl-CoA dehydrogenase [Candidatus Nanopelagicaceae bacterium]|nr:acyl-CoA dehydrogenase [Candidatus Nanopelagicaceae bacterium]